MTAMNIANMIILSTLSFRLHVTIMTLKLLVVTNADDDGDDDEVDMVKPMLMTMRMLPMEVRICDKDCDGCDIYHDDGVVVIMLMRVRVMTIYVF